MKQMRRALLWALLPLWVALACVIALFLVLWTTLWILLDNEKRSGIIIVTALTGLILGVNFSAPSPWMSWHFSALDASVAADVVCVIVWIVQIVWPQRYPHYLAYSVLLLTSGYAIAKGIYVGNATYPDSSTLALIVLAALCPLLQAAAMAKLWRKADVETCSAIGHEILRSIVRVPYSQSTVIGLHTFAFQAEGTSASEIGVVFLHGYSAGSAYFALNFDAVVAAAAAFGARVFAVDWRGCGASTREPFTPRTTEEAERWFTDSLLLRACSG